MAPPESGREHDEQYVTALRQLWDRSEYDRGYISNPFAGDETARLGLRRTAALLDRLGRPDARYDVIHVAGSKGKGSTCAIASAILRAGGRRTGLYTSPHLHSYRERIAIDGKPISEAAFAAAWARSLATATDVERSDPGLGRITAFELMTVMAPDHFATAECDAAVIEVGLGGTIDATNVVAPVSTAIAALDYEHTRVLGTTMTDIAANKAGIIKPGVPLATSRLPEEALPVIEAAVRRNGSPWLLADRDWSWAGSWQSFDATGPWGTIAGLRSGLVGDHQIDNACLAIAGIWQMHRHALTAETVRSGLAAVRWPGRFEIIGSDHRIVLDGAHTAAAASVLARAYADNFPDQQCAIVLGILRDKDPVAIARALHPIAQEFIAVTPPGPRGLLAGELALDLDEIALPVRVIPDIGRALAAASLPVLVTGSLTTVAAAREALGLAIADPIFSA